MCAGSSRWLRAGVGRALAGVLEVRCCRTWGIVLSYVFGCVVDRSSITMSEIYGHQSGPGVGETA